MGTSFYSAEELKELGFASIGQNVLISRKTSIYGAGRMSIGNNVRIDDFCVLSGKITIGNYVHIAVMSLLFGGKEGIIFEDFSGLSSRCAVYATTDDYSGEYMTNPTVPEEYTHIIDAQVVIGKHCDIGTGSTILPGVIIAEGCSLCAMTLVNKSTNPWGIYAGIPGRRIQDRSKKLLEYEQRLMATLSSPLA